MNIVSAIFDRSAPDLDSCPDESLLEFAFIGRSNVGKSSLLNMLAGQQGLARVSPTPGFTKMINFFTVNKAWRLVDLPGYGFAQVARKDKAKFNAAVAHYLQCRPNLGCVFALIDSGLPPQPMDLEFVEWLADNSIPFVLAFTKMDHAKTSEAQVNIKAFKDRIAEWCENLPYSFTCSAKTGQGRRDLLTVIDEVIAEQQAQAVNEPDELPPEVLAPVEDLPGTGWSIGAKGATKKSRKSARPW
jgi:GTP-binding protein